MDSTLKKEIKLNYNLVIDGASGILGYKLAEFFINYCNKVFLIGRSPKTNYKRKEILKKNNIEYYSDYSFIPKEDIKGAVFIHTASSTPNNNVLGDEDIFAKNLELRNTVTNHIISSEYKLIINISSMSVYGKINTEFLFENYPTLPINLYGLSKLLSENQLSIISNFSSFTNLLHLRLPGIISKESRGIFIASLIEKIKNNQPIKVFSKDSLFNNATTSYDIARTIKSFIEIHEHLPKEVFLNMCSKDVQSIYKIINLLSMKLNRSSPNLLIDKNISTFLIKNHHNYKLLKNSLLSDMFNEILEGY